MEIYIDKLITQSDLEKAKKIEQRTFLKKTLKSISVFYFIGLLLTFRGINGNYDLKKEIKGYNVETKEHFTKTIYYENRITFGVGLGLLFFCLYYTFSSYRYSKRVLKEVFQLVNSTSNIIFKANEERIYYEDYCSKGEYKWDVFNRYNISTDFLFLYKHPELVSSLVVPLIELKKEERSCLENLLVNNISKK
jgi:hypothetical protein